MKNKDIVLRLVILLFTFSLSHAQTFNSSIKGRILNKSTGAPIIGANVYIAGTLWGTTSDLGGNYTIKSLPNSNLELVVSMIGFEPVTMPVLLRANSTLKMNVDMKQKIYEYGVVQVEAERPDDWQKDLIKFKKLFLGSSDYASQCEIENEVMIDFNINKDGIFSASAREPLVIKNFALGLEIFCIMKSFIYDETNQHCKYKIVPTFKMMEPESETETEMWKRNQSVAYKGSLDYFMITLKKDSLFERGYKVQYCESPMWKEFRVSMPIASSDSLLTRGYFPNEHILSFSQYLRITRKNNETEEEEISFLRLPYGRVFIDEYGYLHDDMGVEVLGEWTSRGIADLLPKYYFSKN